MFENNFLLGSNHLLTFLATCGGNFLVSDDKQAFSTPNWPNNYPANQDCYWVINPVERKYLEVTLQTGETKDMLNVKWVRIKLLDIQNVR